MKHKSVRKREYQKAKEKRTTTMAGISQGFSPERFRKKHVSHTQAPTAMPPKSVNKYRDTSSISSDLLFLRPLGGLPQLARYPSQPRDSPGPQRLDAGPTAPSSLLARNLAKSHYTKMYSIVVRQSILSHDKMKEWVPCTIPQVITMISCIAAVVENNSQRARNSKIRQLTFQELTIDTFCLFCQTK